MNPLRRQHGFTLVEVIMVIVIMAVLAAVAMKTLDSGLETSRVEETRNELEQLTYAIGGNPNLFANGFRTDFGYVGDVGSLPANLDALVTSPGYGTWKGPYIKSEFSNFSDDYKKDAWGKLYIYSGGNTIKAAGSAPDTLVRVLTSTTTDLTANTITALVTDGAGNPPGDSASKVRVVLSYPNGAGGTKDSTLIPNSSGMVTYANCVPVGNRSIRAVYLATNDTVQTMLCVLPKSAIQSSLRFPGALWAAGGGGGGGSLTDLQYVGGSAVVSGAGNSDLEFAIENPTTSSKHLTTIVLTYSKTAYYQIVKWGSTTVFNSSSPRAGSGETVTFSSGQNIGSYGQMITIQVNNFKSVPTGVGSNVDMSNTQITVVFSDGSSMTFTTP